MVTFMSGMAVAEPDVEGMRYIYVCVGCPSDSVVFSSQEASPS